MPIFEFTCKSCKDDFELLVGSVARSEDKKCPNCGSADINKRFSVFGFKSSGNGAESAGSSGSSCSCSGCSSSNCSSCSC